MAEHVLQIRNKENNAHLLLQRPAPQPWVVLQQLLIAQAVLHRAGDVTHPKCRPSARCPFPPASLRPHRCRRYGKLERLINFANAGLDGGGPRLHEEAGSCRGWLQMEEESAGCHGSDIPARGGHQSESGTGRRRLRGRGTAR